MNQPISSDSTPSTTPTTINAPVPSKPSVAEIITPFLHKPRAYKKISKTKSLPPVNDTRARDHICDVCNAKFLRHQDLHRHKAVHSTSRDYACLWNCGSTFARADAVTRHMKKRTCRNAPPLED
ncbi:hypothetical protein BCR33DRAFT_668019 [Rhizoclosmatium globosum]|uniref:C2H2-type domain-containing protein n=2 Tax=Rhizoclosmatium globosum TaxID=329046 RepID=A0A1Y2AWV1_9FUNG|nr:hypothetical protein BCR33DRAFT_668019 [Rhizoclosmatium globosum]|eukprot:ORY26395.1 hypothetical protein BCR33DRAFT_668019 [Rhizoclosmatium globosum]